MSFISNEINNINRNPNVNNNTYLSTSSRCRIKIFHFSDPNPDPDQDDSSSMDVDVYDLNSQDSDNPLIGFSYSKSNAAAGGFFNFTLLPIGNFLQILKPGDWVIVYLSNGGSQQDSIRCFGTVDTINFSERLDPSNGAREIIYSVSCRDFGKVFENYFIYINVFVQNSTQDSTNANLLSLYLADILNSKKGGPDEIIKFLINTFLGANSDGAISPDQKQLKQWLIPKELINELNDNLKSTTNSNFEDLATSGDGTARFVNLLDLSKIQEGLAGQKLISNFDVRTSLWALMLQQANPIINEMFCEMTDEGRPAVFLRTYPFTFSNYTDPQGLIDDSLNKFLDLDSVSITGKSILASDMGLTENARVNFMIFLSDFLDSGQNTENVSYSFLAGQFPFINVPSCQRYGSKVFEQRTDYSLIKQTDGGTEFDPQLLVAWNNLLKHWYQNNSHFEYANLVIVGQNDIRLGKRLDISSSPLLMGGGNEIQKSFYIESYVDNWTYGSMWTQTITLTRGIYVVNGQEQFSYDFYKNSNSLISTTISKRKAYR